MPKISAAARNKNAHPYSAERYAPAQAKHAPRQRTAESIKLKRGDVETKIAISRAAIDALFIKFESMVGSILAAGWLRKETSDGLT